MGKERLCVPLLRWPSRATRWWRCGRDNVSYLGSDLRSSMSTQSESQIWSAGWASSEAISTDAVSGEEGWSGDDISKRSPWRGLSSIWLDRPSPREGRGRRPVAKLRGLRFLESGSRAGGDQCRSF
jgi:hypothetical protein